MHLLACSFILIRLAANNPNFYINADLKYLLDKIALGMFALFFLTIQLITVISVVVSYKKLKVYKENERNFLSKVEIDDSDNEELY